MSATSTRNRRVRCVCAPARLARAAGCNRDSRQHRRLSQTTHCCDNKAQRGSCIAHLNATLMSVSVKCQYRRPFSFWVAQARIASRVRKASACRDRGRREQGWDAPEREWHRCRLTTRTATNLAAARAPLTYSRTPTSLHHRLRVATAQPRLLFQESTTSKQHAASYPSVLHTTTNLTQIL